MRTKIEVQLKSNIDHSDNYGADSHRGPTQTLHTISRLNDHGSVRDVTILVLGSNDHTGTWKGLDRNSCYSP